MWGAGELMTQGEPLIFEQQVAKQCPEITEGLPKFGLKQERRRIRLSISQASIEVDRSPENSKGATVTLQFFLPAGCYATTILRELVDYQDMTERSL
jgi:tRNA pseudouridine13 synthase